MSKINRKGYTVTVRSINEDGMECFAFVKVTAQYHRVVDGVLIFRNFIPNGYPQMVRSFAHGHWLEVAEA